MSIAEYKALSAEALDSDTGGYTGADTITIEGVPVYAIPGFDAETGYVDHVSIAFLDDGRDISQWELLTEAFKQCFGGFEGGGSEVIAADGKTRLDFEYSPIARGDSYRLGYIFIQYL